MPNNVDTPVEYHPAFSIHMADFASHGYPPAVCMTWFDGELIEPIIEFRFENMEMLEDIANAFKLYVEIGKFMNEHGYDKAVKHFGLDSQNAPTDEDLDSAIDRILEEGL